MVAQKAEPKRLLLPTIVAIMEGPKVENQRSTTAHPYGWSQRSGKHGCPSWQNLDKVAMPLFLFESPIFLGWGEGYSCLAFMARLLAYIASSALLKRSAMHLSFLGSKGK